ncbi:hypothetical protein GCM10007382_00040 [Salinibacterium xinjiangense]|uniref:Uncharacterized protein n=1 Tax=Salinibacterium xinjiangense TaxID=386302 RepID=A0A2C9A3K7_9MICO|nr:hypothetical protein [Salinibacterium xinjiangense]GGK84089.1 hypothetical protein GCM10007382_00040 [Salinibacterium xinjiangense]SOE74067.1 hypothetical protein SAMN06296378_2940 [Salinibacterium xinjiangense]
MQFGGTIALFGRKNPAQEDVPSAIARIARQHLAELGFETTIDLVKEPLNPHLMAADGLVFPLYNLIGSCRDQPQRKWRVIVANHLAKILSSRANQPPEQLDAGMLRRQVRTRLLSAGEDGQIDLSYARPFAPGLVIALCIDYPEAVETINSSTISKLSLTPDEAFRAGQENTNAEPIDERTEIAPGVWALAGASLFVASKVIDLDALIHTSIGPAPDGIVFATPHRGLLVYVKPEGPDFAEAVQTLLIAVDNMARDSNASLPGGLLSPAVYYINEGTVDVIGGRATDNDQLHISASGRFGELLEKWASSSN